MRDAVPAQGIAAEFRSTNLREIAREVLAISRIGLKNRARKNRDGYDETHLPVDAGRGGGARHDQRRGNAQRLPHALGRLDRAGVSWNMPTRACLARSARIAGNARKSAQPVSTIRLHSRRENL